MAADDRPDGGSPAELRDERDRDARIAESYRWCLELARTHYENFPVLSRFMPARLRPHIAAVYAFARDADDDADERMGEEGLARLDQKRDRLERGDFSADPIFAALGDTIRTFDLPTRPFLDLVSAFRQDILKTRYETFSEVLDYCARSANPVGRVILMLFGFRDEERCALSDRICTALQLINFWQDVRSDYLDRDRIYIPKEDLSRFNVAESELMVYGTADVSPALRELMRMEISRTAGIMKEGMALSTRLPWRLRLPVALFAAGGMTVLEKSEAHLARATLDDAGNRWRMTTTAVRLACFGRAATWMSAVPAIRPTGMSDNQAGTAA